SYRLICRDDALLSNTAAQDDQRRFMLPDPRSRSAEILYHRTVHQIIVEVKRAVQHTAACIYPRKVNFINLIITDKLLHFIIPAAVLVLVKYSLYVSPEHRKDLRFFRTFHARLPSLEHIARRV